MKKIFLMVIFYSAFSCMASDLTSKYPLIGQGEYKWFVLSIYEAKLWGSSSDKLYSGPLLLELRYQRDFKGKDIVRQSEKELLNTGINDSIIKEWRETLLAIFPDIKEGDRILASFDPANGITFFLNSTKELGQIRDLNFSKSFMDIWLGEKTSAPVLRDKLLGKVQ